MSAADMIRKAAAQIRDEQDVEERLGHIGQHEYAAWLAVAKWLENVADLCRYLSPMEMLDAQASATSINDALVVAKAYLGES